MQVVGRACEVCHAAIKSEIDGVGCEACERTFHDACVLAPPVVDKKAETYRSPSTQDEAKRPRKKKVRCPGCGADMRKERRERDRATAAQREELEERRRVAAEPRTGARIAIYFAIRFGLLVAVTVVFLVGSLLARCAHS